MRFICLERHQAKLAHTPARHLRRANRVASIKSGSAPVRPEGPTTSSRGRAVSVACRADALVAVMPSYTSFWSIQDPNCEACSFANEFFRDKVSDEFTKPGVGLAAWGEWVRREKG